MLFLILLVCAKFTIAQSDTLGTLSKSGKENYINVTNDTIKKELGVFCNKAALLTEHDDAVNNLKLIEIPPTKCSDSFILFDKGNFIASELFIELNLSGMEPNRKLKSIGVIFYKYLLNIPDSAFADITNPVLCTQFTKKGKPLVCDCKVFESVDKRRVYIHLVNGEGSHKYEVTWIIKNWKYYGRVVDQL
jgi:hypothetical protein